MLVEKIKAKHRYRYLRTPILFIIIILLKALIFSPRVDSDFLSSAVQRALKIIRTKTLGSGNVVER